MSSAGCTTQTQRTGTFEFGPRAGRNIVDVARVEAVERAPIEFLEEAKVALYLSERVIGSLQVQSGERRLLSSEKAETDTRRRDVQSAVEVKFNHVVDDLVGEVDEEEVESMDHLLHLVLSRVRLVIDEVDKDGGRRWKLGR